MRLENIFLAMCGVLVVSFVVAVVAIKTEKAMGYSFEDRAQLQMLVDACRTGHHLCDFR